MHKKLTLIEAGLTVSATLSKNRPVRICMTSTWILEIQRPFSLGLTLLGTGLAGPLTPAARSTPT